MANLLKIKEIASEKNISLKDISDYIGITPTALSKIMRENSTKTSTLEKIALKLKVPVAIFFDDSIKVPEVGIENKNEISYCKKQIEDLKAENFELLLKNNELLSKVVELQDTILNQHNIEEDEEETQNIDKKNIKGKRA